MRQERPSHPALNVRDDREAPLLSEAGRGEVLKMICPTAQAECLRHIGTTGKSLRHSGSRLAAVRNPFVKSTGGEMDSGQKYRHCEERMRRPAVARSASYGALGVRRSVLTRRRKQSRLYRWRNFWNASLTLAMTVELSFRGATKSRATMCNCTSENPWRHTCCREEWILRCAIAHHSLRLPRKVAFATLSRRRIPE